MLIFVGVLLPLLIPLVVLGLGYFRVRRSYQLFIIPITTLIALVFVITNVGKLPISIQFPNLSPVSYFYESPMLLVDNISWPVVISILTLVLATFLLDIAHFENLSPYHWAFIQFFGGMGEQHRNQRRVQRCVVGICHV